MMETRTYADLLPADLLDRYEFMETGSATAIAHVTSPDQLTEVIGVLRHFSLTSQMLLTRGGNRGPIPIIIDTAFDILNWYEARVDMYRRAYVFAGSNAEGVKDDPFGDRANKHLISEVYQQGYAVDNLKGRIALDVEWNPKDGNLDRDFSAYRAWHQEGLIDVAILITRMHAETNRITNEAWAEFVSHHPEHERTTQPVSYKTTTTANFEKARERILRGDLGTCPILVVGIGEKTWDGVPWDGRAVRLNKNDGRLYLVDAFGDIDSDLNNPARRECYPYIDLGWKQNSLKHRSLDLKRLV